MYLSSEKHFESHTSDTLGLSIHQTGLASRSSNSLRHSALLSAALVLARLSAMVLAPEATTQAVTTDAPATVIAVGISRKKTICAVMGAFFSASSPHFLRIKLI